MSEKYLTEQKDEFNALLNKLQVDLDKKDSLNQQLSEKIDENTKLQTQILALKEKLELQGWSQDIAQTIKAAGDASSKHKTFLQERMNKFDEDMLKHSKRNQKLAQENIQLKNNLQKMELRVQNLQKKMLDGEASRLLNQQPNLI